MRGGGGWIKWIDFSGKGEKLSCWNHTDRTEKKPKQVEGAATGRTILPALRKITPPARIGKDAPHSLSDPRAHLVISGLRVHRKSTGHGKPFWFTPVCKYQMYLSPERLAGTQWKEGTDERWSRKSKGSRSCCLPERRRDYLRAKWLLQSLFPPAQGQTHLKPWTDVSTSWARGVSSRATRPAGCSVQRAICCWRRWEWLTSGGKQRWWRCGASIPQAHQRKWYTGGISAVSALYQLNRAGAAWREVWPLCAGTIWSPRRSTPGFQGNYWEYFPLSLQFGIITIHFAKLVEIHLTPFTGTVLDFLILKFQSR